jgi:hypothetical protein
MLGAEKDVKESAEAQAFRELLLTFSRNKINYENEKRMLAAIRLLIITQIGLAFDKCGSFLCFFLPISAKSCIFAAEIGYKICR